jgi:hypothetical protein
MEDPSSGRDPLGAPSPWDLGLSGDILGRSIDSSLGESSATSWLKTKGDGEVGMSSMLIWPCASLDSGAS